MINMSVKIGLIVGKNPTNYEVLINNELHFYVSNKDFNIGSLVVIYKNDNEESMFKIEEII